MRKLTVSITFLLVLGIPSIAQITDPVIKDIPAGMEVKTKAASSYHKLIPPGTNDFQWWDLPSPSQDNVTETSIAGDGSELVVFYRKPRPSLNLDEGIVAKWTGSNWSTIANATNQCHYPDIDIRGSVIVTTWNDDGNDYGYGTNVNDNWVSMTGTLLNKQWYPRATMAMGLPYMSFSCMYSDGMPSSYYMLHIRSIVGTGEKIELNGGWTVTFTSVGLKTDITGDDNAWYCVFHQQEFLYVMKGSVDGGTREFTDLGEGFRMYNPVARPEIVLFQGEPVVAWLENANTELYVAGWDGSQWYVIGTAAVDSGSFNTIRMAATASELFLVYTTIDSGSEIFVNLYDGEQWYGLPNVQNQSGSNISTADIAIHNNNPVVAFTEEHTLYVKKFAASSPTGLEASPESIARLTCYPNPVKDVMEIVAPEPGLYNVEIKSITGQLVYAGTLNGVKTELDLSSCKPGMYFISVSNSDFADTRKIVKQ